MQMDAASFRPNLRPFHELRFGSDDGNQRGFLYFFILILLFCLAKEVFYINAFFVQLKYFKNLFIIHQYKINKTSKMVSNLSSSRVDCPLLNAN